MAQIYLLRDRERKQVAGASCVAFGIAGKFLSITEVRLLHDYSVLFPLRFSTGPGLGLLCFLDSGV